ncbi:hypothetical protein F5Y08DRAFT_282830 [Xylaria arbuscula]|nr:hypothetical protein F5Y08DRAFT_282830 [Xylaria arbuscula]
MSALQLRLRSLARLRAFGNPWPQIIRSPSSAPTLPKTRARTWIAHACWGRPCIRLLGSLIFVFFCFLRGSASSKNPPSPPKWNKIAFLSFFSCCTLLSTFYSSLEVIYRAAMRCYATLTSAWSSMQTTLRHMIAIRSSI